MIILKMCITQSNNIFQTTKARCYKIMYREKIHSKHIQTMDFNITKYKKFIDTASDSICN